MKKDLKSLVFLLAQAPKSQLDPTVMPRIVNLLELDIKERPEVMIDILDDCVAYSLASDFVIEVLDLLWQQMIIDTLEDSLKSSNAKVRQMAEELKRRSI